MNSSRNSVFSLRHLEPVGHYWCIINRSANFASTCFAEKKLAQSKAKLLYLSLFSEGRLFLTRPILAAQREAVTIITRSEMSMSPNRTCENIHICLWKLRDFVGQGCRYATLAEGELILREPISFHHHWSFSTLQRKCSSWRNCSWTVI